MIKKYLYWNTRGRAVDVATEREAKDLRMRGFRKVVDDTTKAGDYNPVYDRGVENQYEDLLPKNLEVSTPTNLGDILECIEI